MDAERSRNPGQVLAKMKLQAEHAEAHDQSIEETELATQLELTTKLEVMLEQFVEGYADEIAVVAQFVKIEAPDPYAFAPEDPPPAPIDFVFEATGKVGILLFDEAYEPDESERDVIWASAAICDGGYEAVWSHPYKGGGDLRIGFESGQHTRDCIETMADLITNGPIESPEQMIELMTQRLLGAYQIIATQYQ
jgi:hypothetical protein